MTGREWGRASGPGNHEGEDDECPIPGLTALDHTADVGLELEAPTAAELFRRGAVGTVWMAVGRLPEYAPDIRESREVEVAADDLPGLFRSWMQEVLFLQEVEGFAAVDAEIRSLEPGEGASAATLRATLHGGPAPPDPIREIKGVTWHGLRAGKDEDGVWRGRVIFDV